MRKGTAEEARLQKIYQEADNDRMQLHDRVRLLEDENDSLCKTCQGFEVRIVELKEDLESTLLEVEKSRQRVSEYINKAAQWEARFDRLLRVAAGDQLPTTTTYSSQT